MTEKIDEAFEHEPEGVVTDKAGGDAIAYLFRLGLISTEKFVPDDEDAAEVLVDVQGIAAVVDAVGGWRIEETFDGTELADGFGMEEELV